MDALELTDSVEVDKEALMDRYHLVQVKQNILQARYKVKCWLYF